MRLATAIGETLREIRQEQELTIREASKLTLCSVGHLSDLERARREPSSQMLESLAKGYAFSTTELLNRVVETIQREEHKCSQ